MRFDAGVEKVTYNVIGDDEVHTITKSQLLQNLKNDNPIKFNITWAPKHDPIMNNSPLMQSKVVSDYSEDEIGLDKLAISRIDLHYDNGVSERLDCVGYDRYNK